MLLLEQKQADSRLGKAFTGVGPIYKTYQGENLLEVYLCRTQIGHSSLLIYRKQKQGWLPFLRRNGSYKLYLVVGEETYTSIMQRWSLVERFKTLLKKNEIQLNHLFTHLIMGLELELSPKLLELRKQRLENYLTSIMRCIQELRCGTGK